jgi:serine phosphatase RsbU (regulator of sigma subunit)
MSEEKRETREEAIARIKQYHCWDRRSMADAYAAGFENGADWQQAQDEHCEGCAHLMKEVNEAGAENARLREENANLKALLESCRALAKVAQEFVEMRGRG